MISAAGTFLVALLGTIALAGCSVESTGQDEADLTTWSPSPFSLQFVGTYVSSGPGDVASITLKRNGKYAVVKHDGTKESGIWRTSKSVMDIPLQITFVTKGLQFKGTIPSYDGTLHLTGKGRNEIATATTAVGPNESVCDDSGGTWTDDDSGPGGLFCVCDDLAKPHWIPALGGCVH